MEQKRILRVVVASPGDVQPERALLGDVVAELNRSVAAERGLLLELHKWETDAYPGFHPEGPQGLIDPILKVEVCDILIGIFWKRFGTPTAEAQSGTEHEIMRAYAAWEKNRRPQVMVYFNRRGATPDSKEETDQWGQVLDFKRRFPPKGLWWHYKGRPQFERLVRNHLGNFIRDRFPLAPAAPSAAPEADASPPGRPIEEIVAETARGLAERVGKVYIFGEAGARELEKIFVELNIVEDYKPPSANSQLLGLIDAEIRRRRNLFMREDDEREEERKKKKGRRGQTARAIRPDELLRPRTHAVITGAPGCGKTTLLRYLAWKTLAAGERLPVFLELKTVTSEAFEQSGGRLAELLFDRAVAGSLYLSAAERVRLREYFFARLAAGEVAVFLDGLDEVSGTDFFPRLGEAVNEFVRSSPRGGSLVISTRPYALQTRFDGVKEMEIAPLNPQQVEEFLEHYYGNDPSTVGLLQKLRQRRPLRELMRVPFLLGVITRLYREQDVIVENRLELYRQVVWQLVVQLDREKRLVRQDFRIPDRDGALKLDFLKELACERLLVDKVGGAGQEAARLVFTGSVILEKAKRFWARAGLGAGTPYQLAEDVKATPLLREVGADVYAFSHLTIQEYLAADALSRREDCEELFCRAYFDPTLAEMEVLPMALGLVRDPERLYGVLEQLPESLSFTNLRLRARGLAYAAGVGVETLTRLADGLLDFVREDRRELTPFRDAVLRSFSETGRHADYIAGLLIPLLSAELPPPPPQSEGYYAFSNPEPDVRTKAAEALGHVGGERATAALIRTLGGAVESLQPSEGAVPESPPGSAKPENERLSSYFRARERQLKLRVVESLAQLGGERALNTLLQAVCLQNQELRQRSIEMLARVGDSRAIPPLVELWEARGAGSAELKAGRPVTLEEWFKSRPDPEFSVTYVYNTVVEDALMQIGDARAAQPIMSALTGSDLLLRWRAALALRRLGANCVIPWLLRKLGAGEERDRWRAAELLGYLGESEAVEPLVGALRDGSSYVRLCVSTALGQIGDARAAAPLIQVLRDDTNTDVRLKAAEALGQMGGEGVTEALLAALRDPHPYVRASAAEALGLLGGEGVAEALLETLKGEDDDEVLANAAEALGRVGDETAAAPLVALLSRESNSVFLRPKAVAALGRIGGGAAFDALLKAAADQERWVCLRAVEALGQSGERRAAPQLVEAMRHQDEQIASAAAEALGRAGDESSVGPLLQALKDLAPRVRSGAARALGEMGRELVARALIDLLSSPDAPVRETAATFVGYYAGGPQVLDKLERLASADSAPEVRRAARLAAEKTAKRMEYVR